MSKVAGFYVQNFGCRATQADGAALETELRDRGLAPVEDRAAADLVVDRKSTRLNSSHIQKSRMPSSA